MTRTSTSTNEQRSFAINFIIAGIATSGACIGSNPMEVVKTRMQLQGELTSGKIAKIQYRNFFHAFYTILSKEGIRGIQRGLVPGMVYQTFMNGTRLSLFEPIQRIVGATDPTAPTFVLKNMFAGATSGIVGAIVGSPFFLVKARLQASGATSVSASQYKYKGMIDGLRSVITSDGIRGLFRGVEGAIPRVAVGSATQLSSYSSMKHLVLQSGMFEDNVYAHLTASLGSGLVVTTAMNPFDVVSTRLYSQKVVDGKGSLYSGVLDCFEKTLRSEGLVGFYKGWTAHYLRLGPHTVLTFVLWEQAKRLATMAGL